MSTKIKKINVLIIDPDESYHETMRDLLSSRLNILFTTNAEDAIDICWEHGVDLMICGLDPSEEATENLIDKVKRKMPNTLLALISKANKAEDAAAALKWGAIEFVQKPLTVEDITLLVDRFYSLSVNKVSDYKLLDTIVEEKRSFELPTDFHIINPFLNEVIEMLKNFVFLDKKTLLSIRLSIHEILVNAMEHGNLEISYSDKKLLLEKIIDYQKYLQKKSQDPPFNERKVRLTYHISKDELVFEIEDEGKGFNVDQLPSPVKESKVSQLSGRGIFITKVNMDSVEYNKKGNKVTLIKKLSKDQ